MRRSRLLGSVLGLALLAGCGDDKPPAASGTPAPSGTPTATPAGGGGGSYDPAKATATLTVKVLLKGTPPKLSAVNFSKPECTPLHTTPVAAEDVIVGAGDDAAGRTLQNAVVYVSKGAEGWKFSAPSIAAKLDQSKCMYVPHVQTVMAGQPIEIVNSDAFQHNVHAIPAKPDKELNKTQQNNSSPPIKWQIQAPQMVPVKCEVHPWMGAWVCAFSHPFHAVTAADGTARISLPPGTYSIRAWHERYKDSAEQSVTLGDKESKTLDFAFEVK